MAIPSTWFFDYEVTLAREPGGDFAGTAVSLQALRGEPAGLAGSRPRVSVVGETLYVESDPADKPAPGWPMVLFIWSHHLGNWWEGRQRRRAKVRAFELTVPGIAAVLRPGVTLRLLHQIFAGPGIVTKSVTEVVLKDGGRLVKYWTPGDPVRTPW